MRESSIVPTNLPNWPRVATLLPELKLILLALWSCIYLSMCGCGLVPLRPFASSLGLSPEALEGGLQILEDAGLIARDHGTGEIFICDWFRFHKFQSGKSFGMLLSSIQKIESQHLRELVNSKIPQAHAFINKPAGAAPAPAASAVDEQTGVIVRTPEDRTQLAALIKIHGADLIKNHAVKIMEKGERVFVSTVISSINKKEKGSDLERGLEAKFNPLNPRRGPVVTTI